nr:uncharacterized mitochondrial protein AtMg00810-like [Tanacetum cinerariifolium]
VHDALLESPSSNAQDTCKADAPKSSGNPNPTASTTNPLADQMETLTVETPIPTVSSLVSTTCFTDSQEPSSDTRLISKRVTNQEETPSLDNILTLTNMFEDIIRVTINSDDLNGVEADVSNMETTITASPTPTLRIHKDHPKIYQMDVKSAFLYGTIDEEVYVMQPSGFQDLEFPARVYKVEKAMYGLHQAPRARYVKRIFRYLKGRPKLGLWYPKESPFDLVAYSDSDYGGASQDRKSTTGGCQILGRRLISWQCKTVVATSTTEAEYVATASCCGQVLWIQNQLLDYGLSMPCEALSKEISSSILLLHYTRRARIAQSLALPPVADEPASLIRDVSQGEACPTDSGLKAYQDRANIPKTSTLPSDSTPRSEMVSKFKAQELEINSLKAKIKLLEDKDGGVTEQSGDDAPIKGRRLDEGEEAAERVSDNTEEMATVLTSMDASSILTSGGVQVVPTAAEVATATISIPTGSGVVSTASPTILTAALIFTTATESTPYTRRKCKETMVESETPKKKKIARDAEIARIHAKEELQMLIDGLDRNNEIVAKYLQEYNQFAAKLPIERRIELISDLVKYQDNYAKTSEEVKATEEVPKEKVKEIMQLVPVEEIYVEALQVKHPIIDWKLWGLVKETLSIRPATSDKEKELWVKLKRLFEPNVEDYLWTHTQNLMLAPVEWKLYDTCGVHHVSTKDQDILMLIEKDYPLRKGLVIVMISYKLQVENYSQMANNLIMKIYNIANSPRQQGIPTGSNEFLLPEQLPTANEDKFPLQIQSDATAILFKGTSYASFKDFVVYQMDVKSAFLYGKIKKEVYVCHPLGFEDLDFPDKVYKVEKALYGLHQAPRAWSTRKEMCIEFEKMMHKKF